MTDFEDRYQKPQVPDPVSQERTELVRMGGSTRAATADLR
jgi:hypothetical protein